VIAFWLCVVLASLTKGPASLVLPVYAILGARVISGKWRSANIFRFELGVPVVCLCVGAWVYAVWRIDPGHLYQKLWHDEIWGRVTGLGPEGNHRGPAGFFTDMPEQAVYFLSRFFPWSIPAIYAIANVLRSGDRAHDIHDIHDVGDHQGDNQLRQWLRACAIQVLVVVGLFTLSTGKRADYIAGAFPAGAILAAWWLRDIGLRKLANWSWIMPPAAGATLALVVWVAYSQPSAPQKGFGAAIKLFIDQASDEITREPMPLVFLWSGETHIQAMLGSSAIESKEAVLDMIATGQPFWLVAGRKTSEPHEFEAWLRQRGDTTPVRGVLSSAVLPRDQGWPEKITLYKVNAVPDRSDSRAAR
jgi:hypothetical protein